VLVTEILPTLLFSLTIVSPQYKKVSELPSLYKISMACQQNGNGGRPHRSAFAHPGQRIPQEADVR